jgi:hypothetical protein
MSDDQETKSVHDRVIELLRWQEAGCRMSASPSPFYAALFAHMVDSARAGGSVIELLERTPLTVDAAPPLRLMGGVQRAVLDGDLPELAREWPGDPDRAWAVLERVLEDPPPQVFDALSRDPQTNEVGRAAGLVAGFAEIARRTGLPLRCFEIGSSAGLNLRFDRFWYEAGSEHFGDPTSAVRFEGDAYQASPPLLSLAKTPIVERRGCDIHPIDATDVGDQRRLLSYVWPDQASRLERLRAALDIAGRFPVAIDQMSADDWVTRHVRPEPGMTTVLFHSIMWQYLPDTVQASITRTLEDGGATADSDAPLAWLRLEPAAALIHAEVSLRLWPDGGETVLATSGYHGPPVGWLG